MRGRKSQLFHEYFAEWAEVFKKGHVRPVTYQKYEATQRQLKEIAPTLKIGELDKRSYQKILNEYAKTHARLTTTDFHNLLKACILDAIDEGLLGTNPCRKATISGNAQLTRKDKFLSLHEVVKLMKHLDLDSPIRMEPERRSHGLKRIEAFKMWQSGGTVDAIAEKLGMPKEQISRWQSYDKWKQGKMPVVHRMHFEYATNYDWMIYLALNTGLRYSEMLGLTVGDFDFDNLTLSVNKTYDYKDSNELEKRAKTRSSIRKIDIDDELAGKFHHALSGYRPDELIFASAKQPTHNSGPNKRLSELCDKARITPISLHGCRHTHASILLYAGVSIHSISKRLGHAKVSITQDCYSHIISELETRDKEKIRGALKFDVQSDL